MNPYETLGVARYATAEQVKAAFRALAKRHHPDVVGGEGEAFNSIRRACHILCDPAARKLYDELGVLADDPASAVVIRARQEIAGMFAGLLGQATPAQLEHTDVIGILRQATEKAIGDADAALVQLATRERQVEEYRKIIARRLRRKEKADAVFGGVVDALASQIAAQRAALAEAQAVQRIVLTLLDDYSFDVDRETRRTVSATSTGWANISTW